jgi:hypothetical protein
MLNEIRHDKLITFEGCTRGEEVVLYYKLSFILPAGWGERIFSNEEDSHETFSVL